jgi:hypothetical protein
MATSLQLVLVFAAWLLLLAGCSISSQTQTPLATPPSPADTLLPSHPPTEVIVDPADEGAALPIISADASQQPSSMPPSPTPTPILHRLTAGGCCVDPFWAPDGLQILYIDKPAQDLPSGLWGIDLQGNEPQFVTDRLGIYSADMQLRAFLENEATFVENITTGELWRIPNGGRAVSFSPDKAWLAWTAGQSGPPFDTAQREVWISRVDGSEAQLAFSATRAGFGGWFPDGRLLVSGLTDEASKQQALWALSLDQQEGEQATLVELGRGNRLREAKISPDGTWVAYLSTFSADPAQDGLWIADARTGERRRLDIFGGYQWRDDQNLLVVPLDLSQPVHRLLQVEAATGEVLPLTEPGSTPFKIANGDWSVSPDGGEISFVSAEDNNIWLIELPD